MTLDLTAPLKPASPSSGEYPAGTADQAADSRATLDFIGLLAPLLVRQAQAPQPAPAEAVMAPISTGVLAPQASPPTGQDHAQSSAAHLDLAALFRMLTHAGKADQAAASVDAAPQEAAPPDADDAVQAGKSDPPTPDPATLLQLASAVLPAPARPISADSPSTADGAAAPREPAVSSLPAQIRSAEAGEAKPSADIAAPGLDPDPGSTRAAGFTEQLAAHGSAVPIGTQAPADPAGQLPMAPAGAAAVPPATIPAPSAAVAPPANTPAPVVADLNLTHPLSHPDWQQAVATRVIWIANQDLQAAQIKLTPAHLGPIEVRIALHQDRADVWFSATSQPVREALDAALPRLRDMFSQQGLQLGQAAITSDSGQGQPSSQQERPRFIRLAAALEDPPRLDEAGGLARPGLFDGYA